MLIYISLILFCFLISAFKLPKSIENIGLIIIAFFLCFGYMTGTDWYSYEIYYNDPILSKEIAQYRESGYFIIQNLARSLGFGFWTFHIAIKLIVFFSLVNFVRLFKVNIFLFFALFIPEAGLYLFIDCPFRNLIAFGLGLWALKYLFDKRTILFFLFAVLALTFHLSAVILILVFFLYKKNIRTPIVIVCTIGAYLIAFNIDFLILQIYLPLTKISPLISERLKSYIFDSDFIEKTINIGSYIRFVVLIIFLLFKKQIIADDEKRLYLYNITILLLIIYPFGVSMKILNRFQLYLFPMYIIIILYLLKSLKIRTNAILLGTFFVMLSIFQTYKLVTKDHRYVPYTNYAEYWIKNDFPKLEFRHTYNKKHSPYKQEKK